MHSFTRMARSDPALVSKRTAMDRSVAREGSDHNILAYVPYFERVVERSGDSYSPVPTQPRSSYTIRVALKGTQFASSLHLPYLHRIVRKHGDGHPPVPTQHHSSDTTRVPLDRKRVAQRQLLHLHHLFLR